ncbi:hypothetical protein N7510_004741 [Penicillium lagena]|uniref:uncharacterized protein n=1 Tax=Penicillium lagena TaxID=94218 RepID=UPI0025425DD2|nr:uncharacterized protein N7510_004741 [Penicillium lagena]KAJ5620757.1 hypothetical protein N7510_004741 [Penicillium lagena]
MVITHTLGLLFGASAIGGGDQPRQVTWAQGTDNQAIRGWPGGSTDYVLWSDLAEPKLAIRRSDEPEHATRRDDLARPGNQIWYGLDPASRY